MASLHSIDGPGLYVTGTDTGVGKTLASGALLHAMRAGGLRAVGMKPVASGCERIDGEWQNADALALMEASDPKPRYEDLNPFALPAPRTIDAFASARDRLHADRTQAARPHRMQEHAARERLADAGIGAGHVETGPVDGMQ